MISIFKEKIMQLDLFLRNFVAKKPVSALPLYGTIFFFFFFSSFFFAAFFAPSQAQEERPASLPTTNEQSAERRKTNDARDDETPNPYIRYGFFGHGSFNQHQPNFKDIVPSCCGANFPAVSAITGVNGAIFGAGALAEIPIAGPFGLALRAGYTQFDARFQTREFLPASVDNKPRDIEIAYNLETQLAAIEGSALLWLRPFQHLSLHLGASVGYAWMRRFRQYEELLEPDLTFENGTSFRAEVSGEIPTFRSVPLWLTGGLSYEIPLNASGTVMLAPEIFYLYQAPFSPIFSLLNDPERSWRMSSLRAGFSLRFSPNPTIVKEGVRVSSQRQISDAPPRRQDDAPQDAERPRPNQAPVATIVSVVGIQSDGAEIPNPTIRIEEVLASKSRPILPTVFFNQNYATIPSRYALMISSADRQRFKIENLASLSDIDTYYHVLNIIGQRMIARPKARLTLVGMADASAEQNSRTLAIARAEEVKHYLTSIWGITASRITTTSRSSFPSARNDAREAEDSRRVDISSDAPEILDELRFDYRGKVVSPPAVKVRFAINAPAGLQSWKLEALQGGKLLKTVRGGETHPPYFEWNLASAPLDSLPQNAETIDIRLEAVDKNGRTSPVRAASLPVETLSDARTSDTRVEIYQVYSAMQGGDAYSFNDASVQRQILAIARKGAKSNAKIAITGYVDSSPPVEVARLLTEQHARNVADQLNFPNAVVTGGGSASFYNNALPEGRAYNRFVQVEIKTPR
jgi:hypothetical protein